MATKEGDPMSNIDAFKEALGGDVVIPVTGESIYLLRQEIVKLKALLTGVVVAADRMRDDWAEGDKVRKNELWRALHNAAEAAYDEVYPL